MQRMCSEVLHVVQKQPLLLEFIIVEFLEK